MITTKYMTSDGEIFDTEQEALKWEAQEELIDGVLKNIGACRGWETIDVVTAIVNKYNLEKKNV